MLTPDKIIYDYKALSKRSRFTLRRPWSRHPLKAVSNFHISLTFNSHKIRNEGSFTPLSHTNVGWTRLWLWCGDKWWNWHSERRRSQPQLVHSYSPSQKAVVDSVRFWFWHLNICVRQWAWAEEISSFQGWNRHSPKNFNSKPWFKIWLEFQVWNRCRISSKTFDESKGTWIKGSWIHFSCRVSNIC